MENSEIRIRKWIQEFVIDYKVCPFAGHSFEGDMIDYRIDDSNNEEAILYALATYVKWLSVREPEFSNAFLILPHAPLSFPYFCDIVDIGNRVLADIKLDGLFQLVPFHPQFVFGGEDKECPSNLVNRSPLPMIHILKVEEVTKAIENNPEVLKVPELNKKKLLALKKEEVDRIRRL